MCRNDLLYEKMEHMDHNLPVIFHRDHLYHSQNPSCFPTHWHEKIELLYFINGEAIIKCNALEISAKTGDLVVINSNELHNGYCVSESVEYYCIIFDTALLQSRSIDICETKYINPISNNRILFKNKVENDSAVFGMINEFIQEYEAKEIGYEMALKAVLYRLLVLLIRKHTQLVLTTKEYDARINMLRRFNVILEYIENNYHEKITIDQLCSMSNISRFHFCRVFKSMTQKSLGEYLNLLRINKAEELLKTGDVNITEAAMACGFSNINYFSRMFKKYKKQTPSSLLKKR